MVELVVERLRHKHRFAEGFRPPDTRRHPATANLSSSDSVAATAHGPTRTGPQDRSQRLHDAALQISQEIQKRHLPYGTILDPVFAAPQLNEIVGYSRAGDSAIWTGHYLAAESFRYGVTGSPEALNNTRGALEGIRRLLDVTGTDLLARAIIPFDSPFAKPILREEAHHGIFTGTLGSRNYHWIGNTSRDQYSGVFFGLSVAYEKLDDPHLRRTIRNLVTRMLNFLLQNHWFVVMPNTRISTLFHHRPEQQLALLQVGRQVNPQRFGPTYSWYCTGACLGRRRAYRSRCPGGAQQIF